MNRPADSRPPEMPRRRRRVWRVVGRVLALVLVAVVVLLAAVAALAPLREAALRKGLRLADDALPGTLDVGRATWPRLGRVELTDVVWRDGPDTLAAMGTARVDVAVWPLLRGEYVVHVLHADVVRADVPAIASRFAGDGEAPADTGGGRFSPARLPPLAVADLVLTDVRVRSTPQVEVVSPQLRLAADLRGEHGPRTAALSGRFHAAGQPEIGLALRLEASLDDSLVVRLAPLHLDGPARLSDPATVALVGRLATTLDDVMSLSREEPWPQLSLRELRVTGLLGELDLDADLHGREPGVLRGRLILSPPPPWLVGRVTAALADSLAARLRPVLDDRWPSEAPPELSWEGRFTPPPSGSRLRPVQAEVAGAFVLPGPRHLSPLFPLPLRVDDLGALRGSFATRYAGEGDSLRIHVDLDLDDTAWLQTGRLRADTDARGWVDVDTCLLVLPGLDLEVRGRLDYERMEARGTVDVASSVLARWDDPALAGIEGRFRVGFTATGPRDRPRLRADLAGGATARGVSLPAVAARASLDDDHLVLSLDAPAGARYGETALDSVHLEVDAQADASRRHFAGEARVLGGGRHGDFVVPRADLRAVLDDRHAVVTALLPQGMSYQDMVVDSATVHAEATATAVSWRPRAGRLQFTATGRRADLVVPRLDVQAAFEDRTATVAASLPAGMRYGDVVVDSASLDLDVTVDDLTLAPRTARARLAAAGRQGDLAVPRLDLAGELADSAVTLRLAAPLGLSAGATRLDSLWCRFAGVRGDSLEFLRGRLTAGGGGAEARLTLASDIDVQRRAGSPAIRARVDSLEVHRRERGVVMQRPCTLAWDPQDTSLVVSGLELRGRLGRLGADVRIDRRQVAGDVSFDLGAPMSLVRDALPENLLFAAEAETITLGGWVRLAGTPSHPAGYALTSLEMRNKGGDAAVSARLQAWLRNPAVAAAADWPAAPPEAPERGVAAQVQLQGGGARILDASLRLPWAIALRPAAVTPDSAAPGAFEASTHDLDLSVLDDILPPGNRVAGRLDLDLSASGWPQNWTLAGNLAARKVTMHFADGSWIAADGQVGARGDPDSLDATGAVIIETGLLRVPEIPPALLPVTGDLMLAVAADSAVAVADSVVAPASRRLPLAVAAVRLSIPGNLWLRGRGLNVEIAGDLVVGAREGRPVVQGDLKAKQGSLKLLGHFFTLERGLVVFMDDAEALDPDLDIRLTTRVSGTTYVVQVFGSVQKPQLELSSDPEMSEEDIISSLLFGRSQDELEEAQAGMVADRTAQILASYGSVQLQDWASAQLGLDMVSIEPSEDQEDATSLVVGKYLNPKVVVRYEQVMSEESAWYVHLDYLMNSFLKLHSVISEGAESGVEMMWYLDR